MTAIVRLPTQWRGKACPCGWRPPMNLRATVTLPAGGDASVIGLQAIIEFTCPECGMRGRIRGSRVAVTPEVET